MTEPYIAEELAEPSVELSTPAWTVVPPAVALNGHTLNGHTKNGHTRQMPAVAETTLFMDGRSLPSIAGLEVATGAFHAPGVDAIGKTPGRSWEGRASFLEAFELAGSFDIASFGIAWGDIREPGPKSASTIASVRQALGTSLRDQEPGSVMSHLGRVVLPRRTHPDHLGLFYAVFTTGQRVLACSNCTGWPLILMRHGVTDLVEGAGPRLGDVPPPGRYPQINLELQHSDILVGYTAGLPESRRGARRLGVGVVRRVLEEHSEESPDRLVRRLLNLTSHPAQDGSLTRETLFFVARVCI